MKIFFGPHVLPFEQVAYYSRSTEGEYLAPLRLRQELLISGATRLSDCLKLVRGCKATDLRDLVYSSVGITKVGALIEVDYGLAVAEVYARATLALCEEDQSMKHLLGPWPRRTGGASWVLDFAATDVMSSFSLDDIQSSSSRDWKWHLDYACFQMPRRRGKCLEISAVRVGRVLCVAHGWDPASALKVLCPDRTGPMETTLESSVRHSPSALILAEKINYLARRLSRLGPWSFDKCVQTRLGPWSFDECVQIIVKTLTLGHKSVPANVTNIMSSSDLPSLHRLSHLLQDPELSDKKWGLAPGRSLVATNSGFCGIASSTHVAVGDELAFFKGMRLPVVLKERRVRHYQLLADVWVLDAAHRDDLKIRKYYNKPNSRYEMEKILLV